MRQAYLQDTLMRKFSLPLILLTAILSTTAAAQTAVDGMLRDNAGKAVGGANVVLQRAEGSIAQRATSDASGKFHFAAVEAGAYTVKAEAPGFYLASYDFVLRARQPLSLSIELRRKESVQQRVQV